MTDRLDILYRDETMVAINKPAGLLVHRSDIDRHETRFAVQLLRRQIRQKIYPVHRLDKPTSGVLLFALDPDTARKIGQSFMGGEIGKNYLAVVRGITAESGLIDHPLREKLDPIADRDADQDKPAASAVTRYRRLASTELPFAVGRYSSTRYSLVSLEPATGRKHQLRRHMKHISHHIIGDTTHGDGRHNRFFREQFGSHRLLLSATKLCLNHPHTGDKVEITAPLDSEFSDLLGKLELGDKEVVATQKG